MTLSWFAVAERRTVDEKDMTTRLPRLPRPAAALFAAAALALAAPAASQASTQTHHSSDPIAHIALGPMERGAHPLPRHHVVKHHRHAGRRAASRRSSHIRLSVSAG